MEYAYILTSNAMWAGWPGYPLIPPEEEPYTGAFSDDGIAICNRNLDGVKILILYMQILLNSKCIILKLY
jgi:hypothetical protein